MYLIFLIKLVISDVQVLIGLANETRYTNPLQIKDNSNIQNYLNNEFTAFDYRLKGLLKVKIREFKDNELCYYDILILQYLNDLHRIYQISPYQNYQQKLMFEVNGSEILCLDFYSVEQYLILDCLDQVQSKITFLQFNLETNQTSQHDLNYNHSIYTTRKVYFHKLFIIILIKEVNYQIISIYNRELLVEVKSLSNTFFQLSELKVKKIIIKQYKMLVLTKCQKLFVVELTEPILYEKICEDLQIIDIQVNYDQGFFVFVKQSVFQLNDLQFCVQISQYQKKTKFQLYEQSGLLLKFNPKSQQSEQFIPCNNNILYFSYVDQMVICHEPNHIRLVFLTDIKFSKVLISNNFYSLQDQALITRIINPGEIEYLDIQENFFPLLYVQSEQNLIVQYNLLFHGPNITYTFKSKEFVQLFNQFIIEKELDDIHCRFYDFYYIQEQYNSFAYLCQFENKTVQVSADRLQYTSKNQIIFNYQLYLHLNESFQIISSDSQVLKMIDLKTCKIYEFFSNNQLQDNYSLTALYIKNLYFQVLNDTTLQFRSQIQSEIYFTFKLDWIEQLGIDSKVNFVYLSTDKEYLFLWAKNQVIVVLITTTNQNTLKFEIVQVFQNQSQVKQVYLSHEILYLIYSDNGFLKILKYQKLQIKHFSYVGEVDCLGYKVENFETNRNGAVDHFFINSYQDILIFQLSNSLQNSLIRVIHNSQFIKSFDNKLCISEISKIICYGIYIDRSQIQLNLDLIKHSKSIAYEVCASNLKSTKCVNQSLNVVINYQSLKINGYYLTLIDQDIYQINLDIQQGFINNIEGDDNIELVQPMKVILKQATNIIQLSQNPNYIFMNFNKEIKFYHKKLKQIYQLNDLCFQAFMIQNFLMCFQSYQQVKVYNCEDIQKCILLRQMNINSRVITQVKYSGNLMLLKQSQSLEIVYYQPQSGKFMRRITLVEKTQNEVVQQIQGYDFWFVYSNKQTLYLLKYVNFELYSNQTIKLNDQFNKDNQFTCKKDYIIEIMVLEFDYQSITLLFLMKYSTHKAYIFSLHNEAIDIQCMFELLYFRQQDSNDKYRYSLNNELLFIQIDQEKIGIYNVSLNQKVFLRNMLFVLQPNFLPQITLLRNIQHFIENNQIFLFISQNSNLSLFELNLNYQFRILDIKTQSILTLNQDQENIQITISLESNHQQFSKIGIIIGIILVILYLFRREFKKRNK